MRCGLGEAVRAGHYPNTSLSILATAAELDIPVTVHIAIGTDIIHQHPTTDGGVLGEGSYRDFQTFAAVCAQLEGGVVLNIGSAVIIFAQLSFTMPARTSCGATKFLR